MNTELFKNACKLAGVPVTDRQVSKFRNGHGAAHRIVDIFSNSVNRMAEKLEAGDMSPEDLQDIRRRIHAN